MTRTTVVIPNYNGIEYIDQCIASLLSGERPAEIIVVDNGSSDGSLELVQEKYGESGLVRVAAFSENTGFPRAVNEGIIRARTEYVLLLNNDTVADQHMTARLESVMDANPLVFSAQAMLLNMREPEKLDGAGDFYSALGWAFARGKDRETGDYQKPCRIFSSCAAAAIYRREVFDRIGVFDENHFAYLEDIDIGYRAGIYGYHNRYVPEAKVYHAGSAVSGSRHNSFKVKLSSRNNVYLIYKNMPFVQILLNLPFLLAGVLIKLFFFSLKGMGNAYVSGFLQGIELSRSPEGRKKRVKFKTRNLKNYIWIQGQLWINMVRRLVG